MNFGAVVVGGGIIGCTHAYYLSLKGLKVAIVEKGEIGSGTTARNFSWINATWKTANADYYRLSAASVEMYGGLGADFGLDVLGLNPIGAIGITQKSQTANYRAMRKQSKALAEFGYPSRWLDQANLRACEPGIQFNDETEGLLSSTDKTLNAGLFSKFMADQVRKNGGSVMQNTTAVEIAADDDGAVSGLVTDLGILATDRVILAAGPDTAQVLSDLTGYEGFASRFPVNKVPGLLVTTPPVPKGLVRHLVYTDDGGEFHFMPDFNGGLRLASDDTDGAIVEDQSPEHLRVLANGLLQRMKEFVPEFGGDALIDGCDICIGIRAYPADGFSIAGALPGAKGLYVIATHSGVTLAPVLGKLMAELVVEGVVPKMLAPFGLERLEGFS